MDLKQEFLGALRAGTAHEDLLELVRAHQACGITPEESYNTLEAIWLEYGFNESTEDSPLRENLEFVMEKIWYQGSGVR